MVSSVKWLEDELELNALHNPGSRRGSGNEKAAISQRTALSAALGGRVEVGAMNTISGIKIYIILCVCCLESHLILLLLIIRGEGNLSSCSCIFGNHTIQQQRWHS